LWNKHAGKDFPHAAGICFLQNSPGIYHWLSAGYRGLLFGKFSHHSYDLDRRRDADNPIEYFFEQLTTLTDVGALFPLPMSFVGKVFLHLNNP
jgi:hypothetical protein